MCVRERQREKRCVRVCVCVCVCVRERCVRVYVCVCVRERESERGCNGLCQLIVRQQGGENLMLWHVWVETESPLPLIIWLLGLNIICMRYHYTLLCDTPSWVETKTGKILAQPLHSPLPSQLSMTISSRWETSRPDPRRQQPMTTRSSPASAPLNPPPVMSSWPMAQDALFFTSATNTSMLRNPTTAVDKDTDEPIENRLRLCCT